MKLSVNLKLSSFVDIFKKNLSFVLLAFLALISVLVFFVIYGEIRKITEANVDPTNPGQITKVNMEAHKTLEEKLNDNAMFEPKTVPGADAFGTAPLKTN